MKTNYLIDRYKHPLSEGEIKKDCIFHSFPNFKTSNDELKFFISEEMKYIKLVSSLFEDSESKVEANNVEAISLISSIEEWDDRIFDYEKKSFLFAVKNMKQTKTITSLEELIIYLKLTTREISYFKFSFSNCILKGNYEMTFLLQFNEQYGVRINYLIQNAGLFLRII